MPTHSEKIRAVQRSIMRRDPPQPRDDDDESRECAWCGLPIDEGTYCSRSCARADQSEGC
jgi:hypothetical protein